MIFAILLSDISVKAESISRTLSKLNQNKAAVSISIKDISNGKTVYSLNSDRPVSPASTLKIVTYTASMNTLGNDFQYKTQLYKTSNNDLFLKLSGDPFFTTKDLKNLFSLAKNQKKILAPKNVYIDDSLFDKIEWGEGWQWDDDLNVLMPKFSIYNLDNNLINVVIFPTTEGSPANIYTEVFYPIGFMNLVTTGTTNDITMTKGNTIFPEMINVEGTIAQQKIIPIPCPNPRRYFKLRVEDAIRAQKMDYYKTVASKKTPTSGIYLVGEITHPITMTSEKVLKESNNYVVETVFKSAGSVYTKSQGSAKNSLKMLNDYLSGLKINTSNVRIVDGSGVSKNNLVTANFMTDFLYAQSKLNTFDTFKKSLPTAGEGTLKDRMLYFKDNLRAKTGTLSDVSSITGYITTQKGKTYAFDIIINDPKTKSSDKKLTEEYILRTIYTSY
ncbi:MAG: D-alanyl-D-alanine carboxypeptidase/D-alanyl-D-alanine-endopeptidase [Clostridiaceae bacterium]|nr:D-alanyl-D-alanine carboxypeptidase/D-alanyl-D-alanine-endopeptidase [Clostridiaceae bacterium]